MPGVRQKPNTSKGNYQGWYFVDRARKKRKFFTGSTDRQATFVDAWERERAACGRYGTHPTDHLTRLIQDVVGILGVGCVTRGETPQAVGARTPAQASLPSRVVERHLGLAGSG